MFFERKHFLKKAKTAFMHNFDLNKSSQDDRIGSDLETLEIVLLVLSLWSWNSVLQSLNKRKYPCLI